jgi:hypothetical protein
MDTKDQVADTLTKALAQSDFEHHCKPMSGQWLTMPFIKAHSEGVLNYRGYLQGLRTLFRHLLFILKSLHFSQNIFYGFLSCSMASKIETLGVIWSSVTLSYRRIGIPTQTTFNFTTFHFLPIWIHNYIIYQLKLWLLSLARKWAICQNFWPSTSVHNRVKNPKPRDSDTLKKQTKTGKTQSIFGQQPLWWHCHVAAIMTYSAIPQVAVTISKVL